MKLGIGLGITTGRFSGTPPIQWPPTVTSGTLIANWRADMGVTGTTNVTAVADQSGSGNNLTASNGPVLVTNAFGSNPCFRFDGSKAINHTISGHGTNVTIAFVLKEAGSLANDDYGLIEFDTNGPQIYSGLFGASGKWGVQTNGTRLATSYVLTAAPTACVISITSSTSMLAYTDTHVSESIATGTTFAGLSSHIGFCGAKGGQFDLYDMAIYSGALNATDAGNVITALKNLRGV